VTTYARLREHADSVWQAVAQPDSARVAMVMDTSSLARGARKALAALKTEVIAQGVNAEVATTGSWGLCWMEPCVEVRWPDGRRYLYSDINEERVPEFVRRVLAGNEQPEEMLVGQIAGKLGEEVPPRRQPTTLREMRQGRADSLWLQDHPFFTLQDRRLMALSGVIDPENIDHYVANGGYEGLDKALALSQEEIINICLDSGLWGRGGAAFPTGRKWDFLRNARSTPKYIVCNADEGDPGAWVNRILLEGDPHSVIEGMIIAGFSSGAEYGYIYIRDEYPLGVQRFQTAVDQAYDKGILGEDVMGSGFHYDLYVVRGAGAYVCGEETGLIASIQDSRGMPRIKPPFPAQAGLWWQPTNVNNVETLANAPLIFRNGADWYKQMGTERNRGTKMFSLSGSIQRVGVLEVEFGLPVEAVLMEAGGGLRDGRKLKAIQSGGPLGGILPASGIALALEPEPFREQGVLMGSGGLVVVDDSACIVDLTTYFEMFCEDESCGRCTTCHGGSQRMVEILRRIQAGGGRDTDIDTMRGLANTMKWANCVHGQATPTAVLNTLDTFAEEYREHIEDKFCRAGVCTALAREAAAAS
jgi:NADH-quinone oxidoreductase subunit F